MAIIARILKWIARLAVYTIAAVLVLATAVILFIGFTTSGARFAADQISKIASTPDRIITLGTPTGLLSGALRIDTITIADTMGTYAEVRDLAIDWSPSRLLSHTFAADLVSAGAITLLRAPVTTLEPVAPEADSGFSLPVAIDIQRIVLPDVTLGAAIAGKDFPLAAEGSAKADNDTIALKLDANRRDQPDARAIADILFAPAENRLTLKADISEPQGGLIAGMLRLPNTPAINLKLDGEGPLSDWSGKLAAAIDGQPILAVSGHHQLSSAGLHRLDVKGGGTFDQLMPPAFRPLFAGNTDIDLSATFDANGRINIESGNVTTGSLLLAASGAIDPSGENSLKANLLGTAGPVDFRWPLAVGEARLLISGLDISLTGPAGATRLDATAALESLQLPQGRFGKLSLAARSDAFDLATRSGTVDTRVTVEQTSFVSPDIDRAVRGPVTIAAPVSITPETITFNGATLESGGIGGTLDGAYDLAARTVTSTFKLFILPIVLPNAVAAKVDGTIETAGQLTTVIGGKTSVTDLSVKSATISATGDVSLEGDTLTANLAGNLPNIGRLLADARGAADFTVSAEGPLQRLAVKATLGAKNATLSGRTLESLSVSIDGIADTAAPQATVKATGSLGGQQIDINADLVSKDGITTLPSLKAEIGSNTISGQLAFSPSFAPDGRLSFDLPDLSLLAALAGQKAEGDLKGTVDLKTTDGRTAAVVSASGSSIRRDTLTISKPVIDLTISDLKAFAAKGTVKASEIAAGSNRIANLGLAFTQEAGKTGFDLKADYDNAPLLTAGSIESADGTTRIDLQSLSAAPRNIPLKLAQPGGISVKDGQATLSKLTIQAGSGSVTVNGSAGEALNLDVDIANLPASLANAFVAALDAEGTISGKIAVRGKAAAPAVDYQLAWANAAIAQTKSAGLSAFGIKANGRFADNVVRIDTDLSGGGLALNGGGTVAIAGDRGLSLKFSGTVPFSALSGQLAAQGLTMEGQASVDVQIGGTIAAPAITGTINTNGAKLVDVRRNLALNNLAAGITLNRDQATINRFSANLSGGGTISATGTIGMTGGFPADVAIALNKASYVDGTLFNTVANGTLSLKGPLLSGLTLGGNISLGETSITIPEKLPASLSELNVQHKNASSAVRTQARKLKKEESTGTSSTINLDLTVDAPSQIFVRGRGIDAELGGKVMIRGTASEPIVSGGFEMRRGRLIILTKRLDFTDGKISFGGALTPTLDMEATSTSNSTTITIGVVGPADDPGITFSSSPALPQDEILAQLIFGQSMAKLSPLQIAQLADAVSQLAGGRSTSLFQSLRSNLGVDDLDVSTDEKGRAQVGVGRYINKRTYLELKGGGDSGGKAIINLDVGRGVKLRGEAGSDGSGAAGIFYEKEY